MIRNGVCLVVGEAIAQKAPKLWKQLSKWGSEFKLENWNFLDEFLKLQKNIKAKDMVAEKEHIKISPDFTFIKDLVAGRPVLAYPLANGGFRLRYGRSRVSGFSAASIHPATMFVLDKYIAIGVQLKVERPGKAASMTACDTIEGPIVKLNSGEVKTLNSVKEAKQISQDIAEILFLGDILFSYGDFFNRAHTLVPPGYCEEWWVKEFEKAIVDMFGSLDVEKSGSLLEEDPESIDRILKNPLIEKPNSILALKIAKKFKIPLHPKYTWHWNTISTDDFISLIDWLHNMKVIKNGDEIEKIVLPLDERKRYLELIGMPHKVATKEFVVIEKNEAIILLHLFNITGDNALDSMKTCCIDSKAEKSVDLVKSCSSITVRDKSGIFIGARMGRPEKAKMRKLTGSPHVLFPVGDEGGRLRCFQSAMDEKKITAEMPVYYCSKCKKQTIYKICEVCNTATKKKYYCKICGELDKEECEHGSTVSYRQQSIDSCYYFQSALKLLNMTSYPDLIKGVRGTSNKDHTPEHLAKGILRAKHSVFVNKDGTTRYDMTQLPITHFKPKEIFTSVEKLKSLGYTHDVEGKELSSENQVLELLPQDVILPSCDQSVEEGADRVLLHITQFIDDLLVSLYGLKPFYKIKKVEDLVGHIVVGLAPHTAAGIATRIIGFTKTQGFFAHPMIHAAMRRDCDGDEACIILLMDLLINFSRKYLPAHRGATQDAPLVLTSTLIPSEVDDMVFDMDVAWNYPLEFYNGCLEYKKPWEVNVEQVSAKLKTENPTEGYGFTHNANNINSGVRCSAYKTIPSMEDKLKGQMALAEKIRAVNASDVANMVISKHFIKDLKGNLRKFSIQNVRCVKCNQKFRRPPLIGKCSCGGRIIFTIAEGSVVKYLEPSMSLADKYDVPVYVKQTLELTKQRVEEVFGKEKEKQSGLGKWF
jgi:DNA polymerase II large subunit